MESTVAKLICELQNHIIPNAGHNLPQEKSRSIRGWSPGNCILVCEVVFYVCFLGTEPPEVLGAMIFKFGSLCVLFTLLGGAYWKGRSPISANKLGLPSTEGI